jgi:RNA polymerase sigma-70 factor (ECF subfamily)
MEHRREKSRAITHVNLQVGTPNDLVSRIVAGDPVAETELFNQYATGVRLMLLKRTGSRQLSHDLCQEVMIVTIKKLRSGGLRKPASLAAFIRQTAVYLCIDHYRREKRYTRQKDGIISLQLSHNDKKAQSIDKRQVGALVEELLDQLSIERDREILRRFYLHEEDKTVICDDMGLSSAHFDRVLYRAKRRMRELIRQRKGLQALLFGSLRDD